MVASEPRLSEVVEMYESLGFEVRLEPVDPESPECSEEECTLCFEDPELAAALRVVYTKRRPDASGGEVEDLFDGGEV